MGRTSQKVTRLKTIEPTEYRRPNSLKNEVCPRPCPARSVGSSFTTQTKEPDMETEITIKQLLDSMCKDVDTMERQFHNVKEENDVLLLVAWSMAIAATVFMFALILFQSPAHASTYADYTDEQIVNAIYHAEGGAKAKKAYGILSVPCETHQECRKIALNTVRNNRKRYADYGSKTYADYLSFLASRYAPVGAENDPNGLNKNWLKNVKYFLANPKPVEVN